jgi:hypothetical protein
MRVLSQAGEASPAYEPREVTWTGLLAITFPHTLSFPSALTFFFPGEGASLPHCQHIYALPHSSSSSRDRINPFSPPRGLECGQVANEGWLGPSFSQFALYLTLQLG